MGAILVVSGIVAAILGTWRGYANAREALGPLAHEGDPTRTAIERNQPLLARPRVRLFARRVGVALAWLGVGMYGLYLLSVGLDTGL